MSDGISDIEKSNRLEVEDWVNAENMGPEVWDALRDAERDAGMHPTYTGTALWDVPRLMDPMLAEDGPTREVEAYGLVHMWALAFATTRLEGIKPA